MCVGAYKLNEIYNVDCLEGMKNLPDACIDLVVTSPPYDNLRDYKGYSFEFGAIAQELYRVLKSTGILVWVVGDKIDKGNKSLTSFRQCIYFQELGFKVHDVMIYRKKILHSCDLMLIQTVMNICLYWRRIKLLHLILLRQRQPDLEMKC